MGTNQGGHSNEKMGITLVQKFRKGSFFQNRALYMRKVNIISNLCKIGLKR